MFSRKHLTPLEQLVMDHVWAHPDSTAEACREGVADQRALKESTAWAARAASGRLNTQMRSLAHGDRP
jgi:hypothetical protein